VIEKIQMADLALFGGKPAFDATLHVGRPNIGDRDRLLEMFNDILDRRWLTNNGPYVREFEHKLADFVGVKNCVAMCNATVALEIAARATGLTGEVIVPSFTFVATAHSLQWQEITPVFCDVDPATHNIDPQKIERLLTPRTTGIIGTHLWGRACAIDSLSEIAQRHDLKLLFDAAHALGCSHLGKMIGGFGDAEVFSFHATKLANSFEGGAVMTNDDGLAERMRLMRNFGFAGLDTVIYIGTNGKMNEVSAAMGLTSLESFDRFVEANRRNYLGYGEGLDGIPGTKLVGYDEQEKNNYQYVILEIDAGQTTITRDQLMEILHAENVRARRYFYPGCHRMEPYRSYFPNAGLLLPETDLLVQRVLSLPTGTALDLVGVNAICAIIRFVLKNAEEISLAWSKLQA
jgi:dTDP-4-amino-4,6-dideoxygalactose transaminase